MKKVFITICVLVSQSSSAVFLNDLDDTDASIERAWREAPYAAFGLRFDENGDAFRAGSGDYFLTVRKRGPLLQ